MIRWHGIPWNMPRCWKATSVTRVYTPAVSLSDVMIYRMSYLSVRRKTRIPARRCWLPNTRVPWSRKPDWSRWTSWAWRPCPSSRKRSRTWNWLPDMIWISTISVWRTPRLINCIATERQPVHSSSSPPVCKSIWRSCNLLNSRTWSPWTPCIARAQWITSLLLSPVNRVRRRSSTIFPSWNAT